MNLTTIFFSIFIFSASQVYATPLASLSCETHYTSNNEFKKTTKNLYVESVEAFYFLENETKDENLTIKAGITKEGELVISYDAAGTSSVWTGTKNVRSEINKNFGGAGSEGKEQITSVICTLTKC